MLCSPMVRAQETLACSRITYDHCRVWYAVREQRVDPCDFLQGEEATAETESDQHLAERVDRFLRHMHQAYPPTTRLLVVSHCEFIHAVGESPQNASFVTLDIPERALASLAATTTTTASGLDEEQTRKEFQT